MWASFPRKFLTAVILDGQLKRDRTSERHSSEVISIEYMFVQGFMSYNLKGHQSLHDGEAEDLYQKDLFERTSSCDHSEEFVGRAHCVGHAL